MHPPAHVLPVGFRRRFPADLDSKTLFQPPPDPGEIAVKGKTVKKPGGYTFQSVGICSGKTKRNGIVLNTHFPVVFRVLA